MADIIPFKGTLYNLEKISDPSKVVAPPYDVISKEEQDQLYNSNPYNIIRILLGKDLPGDDEKENKYTRAARTLKEWQEKEVLKKDKNDSIYVYEQEFSVDGQRKKRLGFLALLKLEEFDTGRGSVYPHEYTLDAPKRDRTSLLSSIEANLGPIFALFADEDKSIDKILAEVAKSQPIMDLRDPHGMRNKLWRVSDKEKTERITGLMKKEKIFIADGHHRYEVGLEFSKTKKDPKYGYILTYFTDLYADGIVVLPTHRLIGGLHNDVMAGLKEDLKKDFSVQKIASKNEIRKFLSGASPSEKRFAMYTKGEFTGLVLKDNDLLDVAILHDMVVEPLKKKAKGNISIDFTKDIDYAVKEVDAGRFSLSIMLNATKITEIRDVAFAGKRMPQKSTYFYPKVLTGLVINVF
ncbi:MAG: DUF1015 domain-containing protein [Candidatus Omnitrophica bacterium]|nr:DUF1015 domain-containing protein [Candidatus Omnitrophota bacterium]MBU4590822.1 DUF1015 domain-containing protein [Candidatus Omnitrophota bacterium]